MLALRVCAGGRKGKRRNRPTQGGTRRGNAPRPACLTCSKANCLVSQDVHIETYDNRKHDSARRVVDVEQPPPRNSARATAATGTALPGKLTPSAAAGLIDMTDVDVLFP